MQTERLIKNMMDQVKELQIKLGYARETIRLYYPLSSLQALLGENSHRAEVDGTSEGHPAERNEAQALLAALRESSELQGSGLGLISFSRRGDRFEINIPPEGAEYVYEQVEASAFLVDLIDLFQKHHHCSLEEIREVFARYAKVVRGEDAVKSADAVRLGYLCEQMPDGTDFDYMIRFEDPSIDEYYYCIKMEMGHTIYHRFMREDYEALL